MAQTSTDLASMHARYARCSLEACFVPRVNPAFGLRVSPLAPILPWSWGVSIPHGGYSRVAAHS